MQLLELKIKYPASFINAETHSFKSDLHVVPKAKGLGIIGLAELITSIYLSEEIKDQYGKPASLKQLAKSFEYIFNCDFGNIYDKQKEVYNRKSYNLTKALDFLKRVLEQNKKSRNKNN